MSAIIQFNWQRYWKKRVVPHIQKEIVQKALDEGMSRCDPEWKRGDAPYQYGGATAFGDEPAEGSLSWYQPIGRCHHISLFSLVIGLINYPKLSWELLTCARHAVPIGYGANKEPRVVMDILNFDRFSAEQSIAFANPGIPDEEFWKLLSKRPSNKVWKALIKRLKVTPLQDQ